MGPAEARVTGVNNDIILGGGVRVTGVNKDTSLGGAVTRVRGADNGVVTGAGLATDATTGEETVDLAESGVGPETVARAGATAETGFGRTGETGEAGF